MEHIPNGSYVRGKRGTDLMIRVSRFTDVVFSKCLIRKGLIYRVALIILVCNF